MFEEDSQFDEPLTLQEVKDQMAKIEQDLQNKKIEVEKSTFLTHPSDTIDSRPDILFVGDYAYIAAHLFDFLSGKALRSNACVISSQRLPSSEEQQQQHSFMKSYETTLQQNELNAYKTAVLENAGLGADLFTEEQLEDKVKALDEHGHRENLHYNSKILPTGDFRVVTIPSTDSSKINHVLENTLSSEIFADIPVKCIVILHSSPVSYKHESIPTLAPTLSIDSFNELNIDASTSSLQAIQDFLTCLPDVLMML